MNIIKRLRYAVLLVAMDILTVTVFGVNFVYAETPIAFQIIPPPTQNQVGQVDKYLSGSRFATQTGPVKYFDGIEISVGCM